MSVSTDRRQGVNSSAAIKVPCRAATTGNITLSGEQTIDSIACVTNDRVLVKDQTNDVENGIYTVDTGVWSRTIDFDGYYDVVKGTLILVLEGTTNGPSFWQVTTANPVVVDTSSLTFALRVNSLAGVSAFMNTLLDDANAGIARLSLELTNDDAGRAKIGAASLLGSSIQDFSAKDLAVSGTISSTKACASGYTRISPNLCARDDAGSSLVSLTLVGGTPTEVSLSPTVPSDAKAALLQVLLIVQSENSTAIRTNSIKSWNEAAGSNQSDQALAAIYEFSAISAGTTIGSISTLLFAPITSSGKFTCTTQSTSGGAINYRMVGYWD